ncbi:unnamed protein product [Spodoptera littoralis]|uniref:CHK kinase-like domain-containing protein n=1 Tax=Spodoptera littoralis TaxID=7109 RepID=A0A9P0MVG4_SPOLI|nr:unnamed protein product [Spodoptera littoralis]CAH1634846.1 unnamed protein product [Spodoptera littoralis]
MAPYNFEGDFGNLSESQIEFINKVIEEQDLKVNKVVFKPVGQAGDNFVANVMRISIEGENGSMKMVIKIAPGDEKIRTTVKADLLFHNEHVMYTEVLPKLVALQKAAGVPEEEHLRYAKCYGSLNEAPYEIILLEDLNESDFKMLNKFDSLSDECVRSILKNFAILHSVSYALKEKQPETFESFKSKLIDVWSVNFSTKEARDYFQLLENSILANLDEEEHKSKFKSNFMEILKLPIQLAQDRDCKYSIVQQGDAWTNNIMFKFSEDKLEQSVMIDYQGSKISNPVGDILYMIFNCTDHETRSIYYYDWIDYYHTELDRCLSYYDLKINYIYPRDRLDADLRRYGKISFGLSSMLTYVLMRDTKEAGEMLESFKSGDPNDEGDLRESVMVDYQASSSHNPMTDILFMIYICTDHEARSQNLHDWLDYYHSELDKSLSHFGLKANDIYLRDQLDADLKRYVLFNNVLMRDASEVAAMMEALKIGGFDGVMENMDKHAMSKETFDRSKKRLLDLIETYTQYDLL